MSRQSLEASRVQDMMWMSKLLFTHIPPIRLLCFQTYGATLSTATAKSVFQLHALPVHASHSFPARTYTNSSATQEIPFNWNHSRSIVSERAHSYAGAATSTQLLHRCTLVFCCAFHGFHEFLLIRVRKHCLNSYIFFCIYSIFFKFSIIFSTFYFLHKNQNFTVVFFAKILFLCG